MMMKAIAEYARGVRMIRQNKEEALAIVERLEQDVADIETAADDDTESGGMAKRMAKKMIGYTAKRVSGVDPDDAVARVRKLKKKHPERSAPELVERLIKAKCQKTAAIGAGTSAASVIPVLGTALSLTVGLAIDISSTLKLHSELVLEIAEAHGHELTETQRSEVMLAVTGLSTGIGQIGGKAVKGLSHKVGELAAQKWLAKAVPAFGMAASASTNVLSTYIIGKRADAYFVRGPEGMGDFKDNLRAITGVDERKIARWISESADAVARASTKTCSKLARGSRQGVGHVTGTGKKVGRAVSNTAGKVVDTGKKTGGAVFSSSVKAKEVISRAGKATTSAIADKTAKALGRLTRKNKP